MDNYSCAPLPFNSHFPARRVYTSMKRAVEKWGQFRHVVPNDDTFVIMARHGMSLLALGEKVILLLRYLLLCYKRQFSCFRYVIHYNKIINIYIINKVYYF